MTITPKEARERGMRAITIGSPYPGEFIRNVIRDMRSIPETEWALVNMGLDYVAVWRVPAAGMRGVLNERLCDSLDRY